MEPSEFWNQNSDEDDDDNGSEEAPSIYQYIESIYRTAKKIAEECQDDDDLMDATCLFIVELERKFSSLPEDPDDDRDESAFIFGGMIAECLDTIDEENLVAEEKVRFEEIIKSEEFDWPTDLETE